MGYYDGSMKINREEFANNLRDIASGVENGSYISADPELRDELLSLVDDLYCTSFEEDEDDEDEDEDEDEDDDEDEDEDDEE